ncbi:MAG: methyltransferase domain-containing protein [Nocardioidaceae bacterium]|nr:methyltransferase domain-containing protein [Nocardioidaceae bacterium]
MTRATRFVSQLSTRPPAVEAFADALRGAPCQVVGLDRHPGSLPATRWRADADHSDDALLSRCSGATVDIGCGPGRMTKALMARGVHALGIDIVEEAVHQTRARGGIALQRDVFRWLPGEGRWDTALLADGNIGIGGDPRRLLGRVGELLAPTGRLVVDLSTPGGPVITHRLRLEVNGVMSRRFPWAVVPADQIEALAVASCLRVLEVVNSRGRWFAELGKGG